MSDQPDLFSRFEEEDQAEEGPHTSVYAPPPVSEPEPEPVLSEPVAASLPPEDAPQDSLFDKGEWWEPYWEGMPEFIQKDLHPWKTINVHFESREDMAAFAELVGQTLTRTTQAIWYPELDIHRVAHLRYISDKPDESLDEDERKAVEDGRLEIESG